MARLREREILRFCTAHRRSIAEKRIDFQCRVYAELPVLHGFMVDSTQLYVSACGLNKGRLVGSPNPYLFFRRSASTALDPAAAHLFEVFTDWFGHSWGLGRRVWP
jgi:hypothetical protein